MKRAVRILFSSWKTGLVISGLHVLLWAAVLPSRLSQPHYGSLHWNPFPVGTVWREAYGILNAPVYWAYAPIDAYFVREFRGNTYDLVPMPRLEIATSCAFHLLAFAMWWYIVAALGGYAVQKIWRRRRSVRTVGLT